MSAVFALPAAVRMPRSAAVRRALWTALLLGGFLALALVFGGSAHAAQASGSGSGSGLLGGDAHAAAGHADGALVDAGAVLDDTGRNARHGAEHAGAETGSLVHAVPAKDDTRHSARVTPVVDGAVDDLTGTVGEVDLRGLVGSLGLGTHHDRHGHDPSGTGHGRGTHAGDPADGSGRGHAYGPGAQPPNGGGPHAAGASATPGSLLSGLAAQAVGRNGGAPLPRLPFDQMPAAPVGPASGSSSQYAGDGHGPRHGGPLQLAAYLTDMERARPLQPGTALAAGTTPTRERSRDVLEFPG